MTKLKDKIKISRDQVAKIKAICERHKGRRSEAYILKDLKEFIDGDLKRHFLDPELIKILGEEQFEKRKKLYNEYKLCKPSASSLARSFTATGVTPGSNAYHLKTLLDLYVKEYDPPSVQISDSIKNTGEIFTPFSSATAILLSQRAGGMCTNPWCRKPTSGPVLTDPRKVYTLGRACAIYGLQPGEPRFDPSVSHETDDIENGIWLCMFHAGMVNENGGTDYPGTLLKEWKYAHEELMQAWCEGRKTVYFGLGQDVDEPLLAAEIIAFMDSQYILFALAGQETREECIGQVRNIVEFLQEKSEGIFDDLSLQERVTGIENASDTFLRLVSSDDNAAVFCYCFAALKKVIGKGLAEIAASYKMELPARIREIAPEYNDTNE